ncbi:hypothetical protein D3C76_382530 [compost metagenome]|jgi:hypothetical protein
MPNSDLLPSLLFKINENQLALEAAIMELSNWVEMRGSADVADNVRGRPGHDRSKRGVHQDNACCAHDARLIAKVRHVSVRHFLADQGVYP